MDKSGLYADTRLEVLGKFTNESFHSYVFEKLKVNEITIDVEKSGFHIFGLHAHCDRTTFVIP